MRRCPIQQKAIIEGLVHSPRSFVVESHPSLLTAPAASLRSGTGVHGRRLRHLSKWRTAGTSVDTWILSASGSGRLMAAAASMPVFDPVASVSHVRPCFVQCWGRQASIICTLQIHCLASQRPCATHITSGNMMQKRMPFSSFFGTLTLILFFQATGRCAYAFALQASELSLSQGLRFRSHMS